MKTSFLRILFVRAFLQLSKFIARSQNIICIHVSLRTLISHSLVHWERAIKDVYGALNAVQKNVSRVHAFLHLFPFFSIHIHSTWGSRSGVFGGETKRLATVHEFTDTIQKGPWL